MQNTKATGVVQPAKYADIIDLPYRKSTKHPQMSLYDRAAQFSPFAALTGHEAAIAETARRTESRIELDEDMRMRLDETLQLVLERIGEHPPVGLTYFKADEKKDGGAYLTIAGKVKKMDAYRQVLILEGGYEIALADVIELQLMPEE